MRVEEADQLLVGRHRLAGQYPPLAPSDDAFDHRPIVTNLEPPQCDERSARHGQSLVRLLQIGQGHAGDCDQFAVELDPIGSTARELDPAGGLLGCAAMIAFIWRTVTRPTSQSRLLSLGSCMSIQGPRNNRRQATSVLPFEDVPVRNPTHGGNTAAGARNIRLVPLLSRPLQRHADCTGCGGGSVTPGKRPSSVRSERSI